MISNNEKLLRQCYAFGKNYYGPLLYGFVRWIEREIKAYNNAKLFFLSRDGFMMKKAYEAYAGNINTSYIHVSRNSLRQSLLYKCQSYKESLQYLTVERYTSYSKLLKYYGFDEKEQNQIASKYNFLLNTEMLFEDIQKNVIAQALYSDYEDTIISRSRRKADMLKRYLSQECFSGNCVVVDIGWHGSMQYYLERFVSIAGINANVSGLYLGINPQYKTKGSMRGYIFSSNESEKRKKVLCFLGGYEKLFQSQEGSTLGYIEKNDRIMPELEEYEHFENELLTKRIDMWQKGAMDYLQTASSATCDSALISPLLKFGTNPPLWGIKMFEGFYIKDGGEQIFVSSKPLYKYKLNELTHTLSSCIWKTGFMKSLLKIPFPYYHIYRLLRK